MKKLSRIALAVAVCAIGALPSVARAQQVWDLAQISGNGNLGTSFTFTLFDGILGYGSVTAFTNSAINAFVNGKGFGDPGGGETGIGVTKCTRRDGCSGDEIGDGNNARLWLDLSGLNPGVQVTGFELASVQAGEDWLVRFKDNSTVCDIGTDSFNKTNFKNLGGTGPNDGDPFVAGSTPDGTNCMKFVPGAGDYLLQSITTEGIGTPQEVVPEPATMTLLATGLVGLVGAGRRRRRKV